MIHVRFGAHAVKSRLSRSPARRPSLPVMVVRTPAIGPSASTVHAASRTALITMASPTVRGATC